MSGKVFEKPIVKSSTTRTIAVSGLLVSIALAVVNYYELPIDESLITGAVVTVALPLLSRLLASAGLPGLKSLLVTLLIPTLIVSAGCAHNRSTFTETVYNEDGTIGYTYEGITVAKAGYGGSIEEAQSTASWLSQTDEEGNPSVSLDLTQAAKGVASPDTGAQVANVVQALGIQALLNQGLALELAAQGNPNLRAALELIGNPDVLNFLNNVAAGLIVPAP